jgi:hypothetical protein
MINHQPNLYVLGVNHEIATVNVREKAAFTAAEIPVALQQLLALDGILEGVILATCNRCEIYVIAETAGDIREKLTRFFLKSRPQLQRQEVAQFYFHTGEAAVRHLYAVACGLNSMIIGEPQITGQIKDAYRMAMAECATGLYLNPFSISPFKLPRWCAPKPAFQRGRSACPMRLLSWRRKFLRICANGPPCSSAPAKPAHWWPSICRKRESAGF